MIDSERSRKYYKNENNKLKNTTRQEILFHASIYLLDRKIDVQWQLKKLPVVAWLVPSLEMPL